MVWGRLLWCLCAVVLLVSAQVDVDDGEHPAALELIRQAKTLREVFSKKRDVMSALEKLQTAAATYNSARADNSIGEVYLSGEGPVVQDFESAMKHFNQSADQGDADAQHNLALMYAMGMNTQSGDADDAMAVLYEYFSSMGNNALAKMAMGYRHLYGYGVPKSCETAVLYYTQVAESVIKRLQKEPFAPLIERTRLSDETARASAPEEDEDVLQYYRQSAEGGNANAQVALGQLYFYGAYGVQQNINAAAQFFEAAAQNGEAAAMSFLGRIHLKGLTADASNATALEYFEKAAEKENAGGYNGLGYMYLYGCGVKKDYKKALKWLKMAAEMNYAAANYNLGMMYFDGIGVDKQQSTALQYFSMAAHQGHTQALYYLGNIHINGLGTVRSCSIGVKLLKSVTERGPWAQLLTMAHSLYLKNELTQSHVAYARLAEAGFEVAQSNSAWLLEYAIRNQTTIRNPKALALRHLKYCSDQGNTDSLRLIGDYAYYGTQNEPVDFKKAAKFYRLGADKQNAQSMFNLGYMHQHGLGLPQDFDLAKRYFDQCLEVDEKAVIPIKLALSHLWLHVRYTEWMNWWYGNAKAGAGPNTKSAKAVPGATKKIQQSKKSIFAFLEDADSLLELLVNEDFFLLVVCMILALLVYIRSRRN